MSLPSAGGGVDVLLPPDAGAASADVSEVVGDVSLAGSAPQPTTNIIGDSIRLRAEKPLNTLSVNGRRCMNGSRTKNYKEK